MAQHDYVIDNSTGANVRADINNALLAISSNNSGSSAPSTTYALQSFANTTDTMLQLRNAANNAFVNLRKFDGSCPLPDGTNSAPSLFFDDDTNTGVYSSAADTLNIATGGTERLELGTTTIFNENGADVDFRIEGDNQANLFFVDASTDRIAIGHNSPVCALDVRGTGTDFQGLRITNTQHNSGAASSAQLKLAITNSAGERSIRLQCTEMGNDSNDLAMDFYTGGSSSNNSESLAMRINNSGNVLIGGTQGNTNDKLVVSDAGDVFMSIRSDAQGDNTRQFLDFGTGTGNRASTNLTGVIKASIHTQSGGTLKSDLIFSTNSGNNISEKLIIKDTGNVGIGTTSPSVKCDISSSDSTAWSTSNLSTALRVANSSGTNGVAAGIQLRTLNNAGAAGIQYIHCVNSSTNYDSDLVFSRRLSGSGTYGEAVRIQNGGGISFNGDTSQDNALDDYEQGTFTPLLSDNISSGTANSYQNQSGHYTKIGNIVHIIGAVRANDISNLTSSNTLCLRGLPFAASDVTTGSGEPDMLHIPFMNNLTSVDRGLVYGRIENGVSAVNIGFPTTTAQSGGNLLISTINSGGNATYFSFSATYRTGG